MFVHSTIPAYRARVVQALRARIDGACFLAGRQGFEAGLRLDDSVEALVVVRNRYLARGRLLWQSGAIRRATGAHVAVLELNPRILSSWVILAARRLSGRPTLLWGHAWPRRGSTAWTDRIRHAMRRMATGVIVYTDSQAAALRRRMPGRAVIAAPNALYSISRRGDAGIPRRDDVLYVGRLVPSKKPELALQAFLSIQDLLPADARLVIVGDGPSRGELERAAASDRGGGRVSFLGHVDDFEALKAIYANALVAVSPGYAGLSLIQAHWFGVPVVIARDEPHSPEIEAAEDGWNAVFVASDSADALAEALVQVSADRSAWIARRATIAERCAARYSLEVMADRIAGAVSAVRFAVHSSARAER